jgi:rod shape-determining protein MreB
MKDSVIANFEVRKMLQHFIRKAQRQVIGAAAGSHRHSVGIPQVERRAVEDSAYRAKASEVYLVKAMALRSVPGFDYRATRQHGRRHRQRHYRHRGHIVVGIVYSRAVRVAGNEWTRRSQYINKYF